jgi:hypothetical protein
MPAFWGRIGVYFCHYILTLHTRITPYASTEGPAASIFPIRSALTFKFSAPPRDFATIVSLRSRTIRLKALTRKPETSSTDQESGIKLKTNPTSNQLPNRSSKLLVCSTRLLISSIRRNSASKNPKSLACSSRVGRLSRAVVPDIG